MASAAFNPLWHALPSIRRYPEAVRNAAPAVEADLRPLLLNLYQACHCNSDRADAEAAVDRLLPKLPPPPTFEGPAPSLISDPRPPTAATVTSDHTRDDDATEDAATDAAQDTPRQGGAEGSTLGANPAAADVPTEENTGPIGTVPRSYLDTLLFETPITTWLPLASKLLPAPKRPPTAPAAPPAEADEAAAPTPGKKETKAKKGKKGDKSKDADAAAVPEEPPLTEEEQGRVAQAKALITAVVDDRPPNGLLPLEEVLTVPFATALPVKLSAFTRTTRYPPHPEVYDTMWAAITNDATSRDAPLFDAFAAWFHQCFGRCATNVTRARATVAARTHWLDAAAAKGTMGFVEFYMLTRELVALYVPNQSPDAFYTQYVEEFAVASASAKVEKGQSVFDANLLSRRDDASPLIDVSRLFIRDELSVGVHERAVFAKPTDNRILITGLEGSGRTTLGRALAERLKCVFVDVFDLALAACETEGDALGAEVHDCVENDQPVSLSLQAQLVARCMSAPATRHRGYVMADLPPVSTSNQAEVAAFIDACGMADWPTAVAELLLPSELYQRWGADARAKAYQEYQDELALRQQEADEVAAKEAAANAKNERRKEKEMRAERQAKIEAGEIEATEEDTAWQEAGGMDQYPAEDEEEPEPEVDEDGNPLDEEQLVARAEAKRVAVTRRKFLAELRRQVRAPRVLGDADVQLAPAAALDSIRAIANHCTERDRYVTVPSYDGTLEAVDYLVERLSLVPSVSPIVPTPPADEVEGIESSVEGDIELGALLRTVMTEAGCTPSPWDDFCPVTKYDSSVLVHGSWAFSCHYRGFMYCFASKAKLNQFVDNPHPYLLQCPNNLHPVLLLQKKHSVMTQANLDARSVASALAKTLKLTLSELDEYAATWQAFDDENNRREALITTRKASDGKTVKLREERAKKLREAEAKRAKKAGEKKKKKPVEDEKPDAVVGEGDTTAEADNDAPQAPPTTEQKIEEEIQVALQRKQFTLPHLLSCLTNISDTALLSILERRVMPETVVLLDYEEPKEEEDEEDEDGAGEDEDEDGNGDTAEEGTPALDADGNPLPAKPKSPPAFDPSNEKMYRRLIQKLQEEMAIGPDDDAPPPAPRSPIDGDKDGAEAAAAAAPRPRQSISVRNINVFGMSEADVIDAVTRSVCPVACRPSVPEEAEELNLEDEEVDETEADDQAVPKNPLLRPGRRAIHQFGLTLKYCPVTLREKGMLVQGNPGLWLAFEGARYMFVSQTALARFEANPGKYVPSIPPVIPPPRLWLLGVLGSGKRTLYEQLAKEFGIPAFSLEPAFLEEFMVAASTEGGGIVRGTKVPYTDPSTSVALRTAIAMSDALKAQDAEEQVKLEARDKAQREQNERDELRDAGEEVEELEEDEEERLQAVLEFEPEDEEAKAERVAQTKRAIAAQLMFVEPFLSTGYILMGEPGEETEAAQLLDAGAFPEKVVHLRLSSEGFVGRRLESELSIRETNHRKELKSLKRRRQKLLLRQRTLEIERWRRRNLSSEDSAGGDDEADEEEEVPEEDPEPPTRDGVQAELEEQFETLNGAVQAVLGILPERRIDTIEVAADQGVDTVYRSVVGQLSSHLRYRRSLLENPLVVTYDQATELLHSGRKYLSSFRFADPVTRQFERSGAPVKVGRKGHGRGILAEESEPEPEPEAPKPKKLKTVTRENDDGETEEVQVTDSEPDEEEQADAGADDADLEPEPEASPEELDEMQAEYDAKQKVRLDAKRPRACVLRNRIYFFDSDENLLIFLTQSPLAFWDQPPPEPHVPTVVSVLEPEVPIGPFVDETRPRTMAHHTAFNLGAVFLDAASVLKWAAKAMQLPTLREEALQTLLSGSEIRDELLSTALACRLLCSDVARRGAVLLNLPRRSTQLDALAKNGVVLHKLLAFPNADDSLIRHVEKGASVSTRLQEPAFSNGSLIETFTAVLNNKRNRQRLVLSRRYGYPVPIHDTSLSHAYLEQSESVFASYCPYTWTRDGKLVDCNRNTEYAAEYCGKQYYFSEREYLQKFLEGPQVFSGEIHKLQPLPTVLPRVEADTTPSATPPSPPPSGTDSSAAKREKVSAAQLASLEHAGCCPVTLYETRHNKGLRGVTQPTAVLGSPSCVVEYSGKKYAMVDEEATTKFLQQPWVYVEGAILPDATHMPFDQDVVKSQSTETYIRRILYDQTARAMLAVARTRPKFPGLSAQESALKHLSLLLKANNCENTEHRKLCYQQNLEEFTDRATLYKAIALEPPTDPDEMTNFRRRCSQWDAVQDDPQSYLRYQHPGILTAPPSSEEKGAKQQPTLN